MAIDKSIEAVNPDKPTSELELEAQEVFELADEIAEDDFEIMPDGSAVMREPPRPDMSADNLASFITLNMIATIC